LLEAAQQIAKILHLAATDGQPAVGIADTNNLFGALEFSEKAVGKGIQPIVGCELAIDFGGEDDKPNERVNLGKSALVLIAATEEGFANLSTIVSRAYLEGSDGKTAAHIDWFQGVADGIICLTGGPEGAIDPYLAAGLDTAAETRLLKLHEIFGDRLYVEVQRHDRPVENSVEPRLIDLAYRHDLPLVATNEPFFPAQDDFDSHDALLAIAAGSVVAQTERRRLSDQHWFKTRAEMIALFSDLPEAVENTVEIARRVSYRPRTHDPILPRFAAVPGQSEADAVTAEAEELSRQAEEGLRNRIEAFGLAPDTTVEQYQERLAFELKVIRDMKFPGYFLIVADFIKWAKSHDIPVGPGRGSGAGSLVAYALTVTDLDPLRYNLLFERFLNPERVSMPDFDIDFCQERRDEVIRYVQDKYGHDRVTQIITFGKLQARAVVRDVGRVLEMPYGQVDKLTKLVPQNPANPVTLSKALTGGTLPLAATVASRRVFEAFLDDDPARALMHGPTFMGNPLACAAANASMALFDTEPRLRQVARIEAQLAEGLASCRKSEGVRDVRVKGAIGVVQLDSPPDGRSLDALRTRFVAQGVWVRPFADVVYLMPPLVIGEEDLEQLIRVVDKVVCSLRA
jgi:DNA polymerase III subunit alpha